MSFKLFLRIITLLILISNPISGKSETALEILQGCEKCLSADRRGKFINFAEDFEAGMCWGAFAVFQESSNLIMEGKPFFGVCLPPNTTRIQMISIFLKYLKDHPERLHESLLFVAQNALNNAFPCKINKQSF